MEWFGRAVASLLVVLVCCSEPVRTGDARLRVVTTTNILADLARNIGGDRISVYALMGPGVDPHLFKASARDVTRMAEADVIVYNGFFLEGKMNDVFGEMRERGTATIALAERSVPDSLLRESELFQGNYDPHVWFDIGLWRRAAIELATVFRSMRPADGEAFRSHALHYVARMDSVEASVRSELRNVPIEHRVIVTSHDAFGYYGRAYGFEVRGLQGISTAAETGTADVQNLAELVAARRIPAMFVESSVSPRGIEAVREAVLARGFDVRIGGTLYGDALAEPGTRAGTYLGMILHNTAEIAKALSYGGGS